MAGLRLQVKVVPGASRSRVAGRYGDGVKVQVAAAPERGKANEAVLAVIAEWLGIKPAQARIVAGQTQPRKTLEFVGVSAEVLTQKMEQLV